MQPNAHHGLALVCSVALLLLSPGDAGAQGKVSPFDARYLSNGLKGLRPAPTLEGLGTTVAPIVRLLHTICSSSPCKTTVTANRQRGMSIPNNSCGVDTVDLVFITRAVTKIVWTVRPEDASTDTFEYRFVGGKQAAGSALGVQIDDNNDSTENDTTTEPVTMLAFGMPEQATATEHTQVVNTVARLLYKGFKFAVQLEYKHKDVNEKWQVCDYYDPMIINHGD